jgi:mannose-1-phosphate guanylyltransferase
MMKNSTYVLILAGGAGTRFWPASRISLPKQFLDITGSGKPLIRETFDRCKTFVPVENIFVITHKLYGHIVLQELPELTVNQVILEPSRNNTAASIAYASLKLAELDPNAVCIVAPADHMIQNEKEFNRVIGLAIQHAEAEHSLITLGIEPSRPDSGYGYIEYDKNEIAETRKVKSFREKPDKDTAEKYLQSGSFAWNAGIFIWKLSSILSAYQKYAPLIYSVLEPGKGKFNTPDEREFIDEQYPLTEKISVDYAILERADNVYTIPCDIGWSDLGTWNSLYEFSSKDAHGNAVLCKPVHIEESKNSLVLAQNEKLIVIKGLEEFIVVDTEDCLLIYPKADEQEIKALKEKLGLNGLDSYL